MDKTHRTYAWLHHSYLTQPSPGCVQAMTVVYNLSSPMLLFGKIIYRLSTTNEVQVLTVANALATNKSRVFFSSFVFTKQK